ncbi:MAG TPA: epoxide hydrolase [Steroidobacteraceae bacterium]|nr:epoxide hydrolase [Steroidobacteraceae bacterium]
MQIRSFRIAIGDVEVADLKQRLAQTRWPSEMSGVGWEMGMSGAFLRRLNEYWLHEFDWRRVESCLNGLPQFEAVTDSGAIHFAHLRSDVPGAIPIVLTHGWPGHFAEFKSLAEMLARPAEHAGTADEAFHVVIPSLPGYAFSAPPAVPGTDVFTIADRWSALMSALGYRRFMAHGGDIGASVSTALGLKYPERVLGVHLNYIPGSYRPHPAGAEALTPEEQKFLHRRAAWFETEGGYAHVQGTKPDVLAPALNDSPMGLAAWIIDKFRSWSDCGGDVLARFTFDELLTTTSLYWFTGAMPSAIRLYWEMRRRPLRFSAGERVEVPVAVAHFPGELPIPPRRYVERGYNVTRWTEMSSGGHFAALEEPEALAQDIRSFAAGFRSPPQRTDEVPIHSRSGG